MTRPPLMPAVCPTGRCVDAVELYCRNCVGALVMELARATKDHWRDAALMQLERTLSELADLREQLRVMGAS